MTSSQTKIGTRKGPDLTSEARVLRTSVWRDLDGLRSSFSGEIKLKAGKTLVSKVKPRTCTGDAAKAVVETGSGSSSAPKKRSGNK